MPFKAMSLTVFFTEDREVSTFESRSFIESAFSSIDWTERRIAEVFETRIFVFSLIE